MPTRRGNPYSAERAFLCANWYSRACAAPTTVSVDEQVIGAVVVDELPARRPEVDSAQLAVLTRDSRSRELDVPGLLADLDLGLVNDLEIRRGDLDSVLLPLYSLRDEQQSSPAH